MGKMRASQPPPPDSRKTPPVKPINTPVRVSFSLVETGNEFALATAKKMMYVALWILSAY